MNTQVRTLVLIVMAVSSLLVAPVAHGGLPPGGGGTASAAQGGSGGATHPPGAPQGGPPGIPPGHLLPGGGGTPLGGGGIVNVEVDGNVLEAEIELLGVTFAELRIEFESVTGLDEDALGLSAVLLGPLDLLDLGLRLPSSAPIASGFPVLVSFDPEPGLEMQGVVDVSLHTELLPHVVGTPLRLFVASPGGAFRDITAETGAGSFRGGGARPEPPPEQFVIASDTRSRETVGESKLDRLDDVLAARASLIDSTVLAELEGLAEDLRDAFEAEDFEGAIGYLDDLIDAVLEHSGEDIPDTFVVGGSDVNAAGELRSEAATLRYTLVRLDEGPF